MESEINVASRISRLDYKKILRRQKEVAHLTGIKPSVSAVIRLMVREAPERKDAEAKRRRPRVAGVRP